MGTPAEFRKYAEECVELAQKATSAHHREMMLSMAEKWLKLADQAQREAEWRADDRDVRTVPLDKPA